jgi:release factor glutamine methyltransferase
LDAEVLLAHARGCQRIDLYTRFDELTDDALRNDFRELVRRRATGTPVAYLVGRREFYSKSFRVTPDVLIPRPETEFVLIALLDLIKAQPAAPESRLVDIGTGSGILAICAALQFPRLQVTASDISEPALRVAAANAQDHGVSERIRFLHGDLFSPLAEGEQFEWIVATPPYIGWHERHERASLARDVVEFEPQGALFAGERGLEVLERLIAAAPSRLVPGGWLICEMNPLQADELKQFAARHPEWEPPRYVDDLSRRPRVILLRRN